MPLTLDGGWMLAVVREVFVHEDGGQKFDDSVHIRGHFAEGSDHWDDGPAVFSARPELKFERPFCLCRYTELGVKL